MKEADGRATQVVTLIIDVKVRDPISTFSPPAAVEPD